MTPPAAGPLFDGKGCLTPAGLGAFQRAAPGRAPTELAAHVAACGRCQQRLLASLREPARTAASRRGSSGTRLVWMAGLVIGALVVLLAGLVAAMRTLTH